MQLYLDRFDQLKKERSVEFEVRHGLSIKTGSALNAAIFKLLKPNWTTDTSQDILNSNGLFFGVWVDPACEAKGIVRYNLHAKKLRLIKGQTFAAREFARKFKAQAGEQLASWPNLSYPKGPITLFEGHVPLQLSTLLTDTAALMDRFADLCPTLDAMWSA